MLNGCFPLVARSRSLLFVLDGLIKLIKKLVQKRIGPKIWPTKELLVQNKCWLITNVGTKQMLAKKGWPKTKVGPKQILAPKNYALKDLGKMNLVWLEFDHTKIILIQFYCKSDYLDVLIIKIKTRQD